jgi:hypothetical protein
MAGTLHRLARSTLQAAREILEHRSAELEEGNLVMFRQTGGGGNRPFWVVLSILLLSPKVAIDVAAEKPAFDKHRIPTWIFAVNGASCAEAPRILATAQTNRHTLTLQRLNNCDQISDGDVLERIGDNELAIVFDLGLKTFPGYSQEFRKAGGRRSVIRINPELANARTLLTELCHTLAGHPSLRISRELWGLSDAYIHVTEVDYYVLLGDHWASVLAIGAVLVWQRRRIARYLAQKLQDLGSGFARHPPQTPPL